MTRGTAASPALAEQRRLTALYFAPAPAVPGVAVTEDVAGGVPVLRCRPESAGDVRLLWFHGGAYRLGSAQDFGTWTSHLAQACAAEVISVDYRLSPEHPFPDALVDALLAYEAVAAESRPLVVGGESAGGGLAASLLLALTDRGRPAPAAAVLLSPWLDLRVSAGSFERNAATDALLSRDTAREAAAMYLHGHPATDPLVSPVLGDWSGQPPILVQVSSTEVLHDDALTLAQAAPSVQLEVFDDLPHAWHLGYPHGEGTMPAVESIARFVHSVSPGH